MAVKVRKIAETDRDQWQVLWKGYQDFYEVNLDDTTEDTWQRLLGDDADGPFCFVAEEDRKLLGLVHYLFHGTTWSPKPRIYLNDLFTSKESRGKGIGRKLIEAVYAVADKRDCDRVYWLTQTNNEAGRRLYDKVATETPFIKYQR